MTRSLLILIVAQIALLGSLAAAWSTASTRDDDLRGYVDATQNADLPFRVPRLGVNAELTQYEGDALDAQLEAMEAAGITWVRQIIPWDTIEPERGSFAWDAWDGLADAFRDHPDLQLVAVLVNSPAWAQRDPSNAVPTAPPDDPANFGAFAGAFAERYGDVIDFYQVWDEPNLTAAWGNLEPRPADYLALLEAAYPAIHSADADSQVIAAALAPTLETGPLNVNEVRYLDALYTLDAADVIDAVATKPYGFSLPPSDRTVDLGTLNFSRLIRLRETMVRHGNSTTPLWASNWGWNALPVDWTGDPSIWGSVTPDQQVAYTLDALNRADREWPWLGPMVLYHWQPDAPPDDPVWGFSLHNPDGSSKPLLQTLASRPAATSATDGLYPPANPYASYSGVWTFGPLGADIGWVQDSQLDFNFTGSALALLLRQDNYVAYLYPTIDGQPANALPQDASGNAYLVLTSDTRMPTLDLVPVARDLSNSPHQLHVVTDRGSDRWALAGYAVSSGNLAAPYNRQITVALAVAGVAALAALVSAWQVDWRRLFAPFSALGQRLGDTAQLAISAVTSVALLIGMFLTWGDATPNLFRREPIPLVIGIVTAGLLYLAPNLILVIVAALILFVLFYHRTDIALALTVFWSPFFLFPVELYQFRFPLAEMLLLIAVPAWLLKLIADWGRERQTLTTPYLRLSLPRFQSLDYAVLAWLAVGVLSLSWATYRSEAITELRTLIIEPTLVYLLLRTTIRTRVQMLRLVDALLLAGVIVAMIGLWLYFRGEGVITAEDGARRLASVYGSPNNVGLFLGRCIPFALAFALLPTDRLRRIASLVALLVMLAAVVFSLSAGALILGVPAGIAAVVLLVLGRRGIVPLMGLLLAGAVGFIAIASRSARFARLVDFSEGTNFYRLRVWQSAINAIQDRPMTGLGLDQFLYYFRGQYILPDAWQEPDLSHPHNILLDFWIRLGILGVGVLIWIQVAFWTSIRQAHRVLRPSDPMLYIIAVGTIGSMVNLIAHGLVDNSVYVNDLAIVFILLLGLAANLERRSPVEKPSGT